jgi:LAO/AO transport system kinase
MALSCPTAKEVLSGNIRAVARACRLIDDADPRARDLLRELYPHTGRALTIGLTGNPGSGKSSIVDCLIAHYREQNKSVAVIAVDPSSPYTGGAILGDRIRMQRHTLDKEVFIRSVATRGHMGGLSLSTGEIVHVVDAAGYDVIILETVGVGQDEVEIVSMAQITCVVTVPGLGDDIQAIKAGLMEIADIFVVNKSDKEGAHRLVQHIKGMLHLKTHVPDSWEPPVIETIAVPPKESGIGTFAGTIASYFEWATDTHTLISKRKAYEEQHLFDLLKAKVESELRNRIPKADLEQTIAAIAQRVTNPYDEVEKLFKLL